MDSDQLNIAQFLDRAREVYPRREIVSRGPAGELRRFTVEEYGERVDRLCRGLLSLGIGRSDRVATLAWNDHRHLELYMAVPRIGAVLHTVNLRLGPQQIGEILAHAGDRALFADPEFATVAAQMASSTDSLREVIVLGDLPPDAPSGWLSYEGWLDEQTGDDVPPLPAIRETDDAAMCYSSATTGRPKGVVYSHRALYLHSAAQAMADTWALSHRDTVLPIVPMFHVNAWGIPFTAIWMGSRLVLPGSRPTTEDLLRLLVEEDVTFAAAVPTVWLDLLELMRRKAVRLPAARLLVSGGGPLPGGLLDLADSLSLPLVHSYGMTEASPLTHVNRPKVDLEREPHATARARRLRQGLLVPGLSMRVRDGDGQEVPRDGVTPGELELRGPWVVEEYFDDPRSDAFADGWYRTGDVINVDPEGYMLLVDRTQDLIKSGGEWISSIELESAFGEHQDVARAAAIAIPDRRWQERPLVFVEPLSGRRIDENELRSFVEERVPRWWVPERIEVVERIPITSVGKIDKRVLRERVAAAVGVGGVQQTEMESD